MNGTAVLPLGGYGSRFPSHLYIKLGDAAIYGGTVDSVFIQRDQNLNWIATDTGLYALSGPNLGMPILDPMLVMELSLNKHNQGAA